MPNLHPLFVHFPIALLLTSVVLDWAGSRWRGKGLDRAAWYTLLLGLLGAVAALVSGLLAAQDVSAEGAAAATLNIHRVLGIATLVVFGLQAISFRQVTAQQSGLRRTLYTALQMTGVALLVAIGYLGGELVYTFGVGVAAARP